MGIGLFRLILSVLVLLGHTSINIGNFHIAVSAVVCFFIVSGFLNSILIEKYYFKEKISDYYLDRFYRIGPQFYFYFLLIILLNHFLKIIDVTFLKILLNLPIFTLGYYKIFDNIFGIPEDYFIIINPPTWSLGLEVTFYLIIPFILIKYKKYLNLFFIISLLFFILIFLFKFNADLLGYRLIPGTLFIFLIGSFLYYNENSQKKIIFGMLLIMILFSFLIFFNKEYQSVFYLKEVVFGIILGTIVLSKIKKIKSNKLDLFFGNISYGIFLNHYFIIKIIEKKFNLTSGSFVVLSFVILISILLSIFSYYFIEKRTTMFRKKIRSIKNPTIL
tara:strand:+ start:83 stop:1078 length:996 start_codon:yes stop_codon:yes gene_type:complete